MLSQVCECTTPPTTHTPHTPTHTPLQESRNPPPIASNGDQVRRSLARLACLDRVPICNGHFCGRRGRGGWGGAQEGRVSARPAKQSPHCLAERTHRTASISFPSNLALPCHMIRPVCNNTQGAEAGRSGNEMIHG